ncbi:MAG: hypothetical protein ACKOTA_03850 [Solirubrobacterales bacterium]
MIKNTRLTVLLATGFCLAIAGSASAATKQAPAPAAPPASAGPATGGQEFGEPNLADVPVASGQRARLLRSGKAAAPEGAPEQVKEAIWAANRIIGKPYRYGGGHAKFEDSGYDCSGTVSYALRGAGLLKSALDSSSFMRWGKRGKGEWITVYTNPGHAYVVIAGLRLDTSAADDPRGGKGPRWRPLRKSDRGFAARSPVGF